MFFCNVLDFLTATVLNVERQKETCGWLQVTVSEDVCSIITKTTVSGKLRK